MSSSSLPIVSTPHVNRPSSIRSVASNSSIASGTSLTRRSRTRTRSRTVTGSAVTRPEDQPPSPHPDFPSTDKHTTYEPEKSPQILDTLLLPPRSLNVATSSRSLTSQEADSAAGEVTLVAALPQQSPIPSKLSKAAKQASNLASIETSYNPALSAFSRDPELTPNARDSFSTHISSTCSSFYPPSTSTVSGPESPASPRTAAEEELQQLNIALLTEGVDEMQEYDGDDVAYRLRLLVNNNYFLPPAHMKPSPEDFAASMNAKKPPKSSAPTFLDIFRVGKTKSKPTTPVSPGSGHGPMLRTTSDSISASYALRTQPRVPQAPHPSGLPMSGNIDRGRVVVVRERMNDIAVAAKQAEQEMKTRNARRESWPDKGRQQPILQSQVVGDVIDPTDAVDVPLPSPNYPFAVQASALHGLGVQESVGAALLADRLPPHSPNMSLSYEVDNDWRKALLQEAVHHSLDNTPDESTFSHIAGTSTPMLASPRVNGQSSRSTTPGTRAKRLQQRIAEPQTSLEVEKPTPEITRKNSIRKSQQSRPSTSKSASKFLATPDSHDSRRSSYLPARAVTPVGNLTPLTPAPRNRLFNAVYSVSQTDFHQHQNVDGETAASSMSPKSRLRRSMSTPMLTEAYESMRQQFVMTPPPPPLPATRRSSQMTQMSVMTISCETSRERPSRSSTFSSQSHFDESDGRILLSRSLRGSPRLSALGNRPSVSSLSQASLSPTTSAFQDALNHSGNQSASSSMHRNSFGHEETEEDIRTRSSLASPPPRPSTSIAHIALRPPPRSSSFNYATSAINKGATTDPRIQVSAPSPIKGSIPYPSSSRHVNTIPLTLEIPNATSEVAIHSPAPSSPTSFFDTIQAQPNAMDDLDSSDESEEDEEDEDEEETDGPTQRPLPLPQSPPPFIVDPRARANSTVSVSPNKSNVFMRLGNFSTPYVGRGAYERSRTLPIGVADSKKALGYTPTKTPFFSERKSDLGHKNELTNLLAQAQGREMNSLAGAVGAATCAGRAVVIANGAGASADPNAEGEGKHRPATASQILASSRLNDRKPEAVRKLDGMLVQHMEAEKDRIRKIAIKSSSQVNLVGSLGGSGLGQLS